MGCKYAVSGAIDWFFENEEMGIILEDDTVPSQSFFWFCEELLNKYKNDDRIMHVGGTNPLYKKEVSNTYYFSKYNRIWGWATWRRAWKYFDKDISFWPEIRQTKVLYNIFNRKEAKLYEKIFDDIYKGRIDTWDYQWFLSRLLQGKAVIPEVNLVTNIGFNVEATHTKDVNNPFANLKRGVIMFPLRHPAFVIEDYVWDKEWSKLLLKSSKSNIIKKLFRRVIK